MAFVTFIHGIANKPEKEALRRIWLETLRGGEGGLDFEGDRIGSQMVYWADLLYAKPVAVDPSIETRADELSTAEGMEAVGEEEPWLASASDEEREFIANIAMEVMAKSEAAELANPRFEERPRLDGTMTEQVVLERIPLPWFVKEPLMRILLRDVHHYLFNVELKSPSDGKRYRIRDEIRRRFVTAMKRVTPDQGPHVVISHSMGTVIAYDCVKRVADCPAADGFMTIGSPLGLDEVQDKLHPEAAGEGWSRTDGFPSAKVEGRWINVYDRLDPVVGFDPQFANDFKQKGRRVVVDVNEQNWGRWRHDITKYLRGKHLRSHLRKLLQKK